MVGRGMVKLVGAASGGDGMSARQMAGIVWLLLSPGYCEVRSGQGSWSVVESRRGGVAIEENALMRSKGGAWIEMARVGLGSGTVSRQIWQIIRIGWCRLVQCVQKEWMVVESRALK